MRKNTQNICLRCYTQSKRRERLFYTVKEWNKFKENIQMELLKQYEVILKDHKTRGEKFRAIFKRVPPEVRAARKAKIGRGFKKFNKYMDQFSKGMNQMHFEGGGSVKGITDGLNNASGAKQDFSVLKGEKSRKIPKL